MRSTPQPPCPHDADPSTPSPEEWQGCSLRRSEEVPEAIEAVMAGMSAAGYPNKDLFAMRLALEEALVNALKHGNQHDPAKQAWLRFHVTTERVLVEVEDEGAGFDPAEVPDPLEPENLERACGRGLLLIRTYMSSVGYNQRGNCISMCRKRSGS